MLNREQAQAELKKLENKQWVAARVGATNNLAEGLRATARSILGAEDKSSPRTREERVKRQQQVLKTFLTVDGDARLRLFEAMAPGLGVAIERGWRLLDRLPYQSGYARKPFRAPGHPDTLIGRRVNWLLALLGIIGPYQQNVSWFAAWAPHFAHYSAADCLGILLAAAIDHGGTEGEEVFQILCASGRNEHEIGGMGRHVTRALLSASRPEGWQFVENMLLAAQREEGLRQVILETVDESHPQAFRRMLKLILDQNLARFSATVRAFDVWLGYQWDAVSAGVVNQTIEKMSLYLEDTAARDTALKGKDSEQAYLALWSCAFDDAVAAVAPATEILKHPSAEHRFVAAHLLDQLGLLVSQRNLLAALEDADLRVTARGLQAFQRGADPRVKKLDLFERLEKLLPRYPDKPEKLKPAVWPWTTCEISKESVADALPHNLGEHAPIRLIPHLQHMGTGCRALVIGLLAKQEKWDADTRDTLFALVGDPSRQVREAALQHLAKCQITPEEAVSIEQLLDRKVGDLRRGALTLLARQADGQVLASADRLLAANSQPQRLAGLELLRQLVESKRCTDEARTRARSYSEGHPILNEAEHQQIDVVLAVGVEVPKLANALGLLRHEDRTWPATPTSRGVQFHSPAARRIVMALDELLKANAQQVVSFKNPAGQEWKGLLSDLNYGFPHPDPKKPAGEDREHLPLADVWENWAQSRGPELRDPDGMELLRALAWFEFSGGSYRGPADMVKAFSGATKTVFGEIPDDKQEHRWIIRSILHWLLRLQPPVDCVAFALDVAESALALVPKEALHLTEAEAAKLEELTRSHDVLAPYDWQRVQDRMLALQAKTKWRSNESPFGVWLKVVGDLFTYTPQLWTATLHARHWQLLRWLDEPMRPTECSGNAGISRPRCLPRERANILYLCLAREAGGATDADVIEQLIGERDTSGYGRHHFHELGTLTKRKMPPELSRFEFLAPLVESCRKRILEVELTRGDNPTAASAPALSLSSVEGVANLVAVSRTLGKRNFVRGWSRDNQSMETVMSHLARCCFPLAGETAENFAQQVKAAKINEERLVELSVYAPQWAKFVEHTLAWDSLTEAVWWIHAHTKGTDWTVDREIRDLWQADMSAHTSLSAVDLLEGAVDVAWFHRVHKSLGAKRWNLLYDAARFASTGAGHARAQLFADAMLGDVSKRELVQRITQKRYQDAVRALGLLPLAEGEKREKDLLHRYKVIQEFRRGSKQFGSQRQASEKRAAQIGQQNLARTAGYADPIRLEWAMEAKAVEDLADGPIEVTVDGVKVSLGIDPWGEVELKVLKDDKILADIPAKLKKHPKIAALRLRKVELKRQASRIRPSLEQFMVRGDEFTGAELCELMEHPLLAPMLTNLVLVGEGIMGYPVHGGKALENDRGEVEAVKVVEKLRIAHPHDFLPAAQWHSWQKECFARERVQPFKQVFRELYPLTATENQEGEQTRRYAGHQVQPRQALALLGQRGWVHHPEEGVRKVFHEADLVAWLEFQEGFFTPAEIEGLTLENVFFTKRGEHERLKLDQLPPRLFSETMRDLDLVVSVAHRGGVDPEASASTIEMRSTLVQETVRLLKLTNVQVKDRYALIKGDLGEYSVHLGSAVTRKMPGESLFIVAIHSQHRGRLFLPFADDDPKTAEVMSKVLLLARDKEIRDPNILDQLRQG
jgi:Family of unknown function (DUF5724)/Domain of unknown function (DUF4132)